MAETECSHLNTGKRSLQLHRYFRVPLIQFFSSIEKMDVVFILDCLCRLLSIINRWFPWHQCRQKILQKGEKSNLSTEAWEITFACSISAGICSTFKALICGWCAQASSISSKCACNWSHLRRNSSTAFQRKTRMDRTELPPTVCARCRIFRRDWMIWWAFFQCWPSWRTCRRTFRRVKSECFFSEGDEPLPPPVSSKYQIQWSQGQSDGMKSLLIHWLS